MKIVRLKFIRSKPPYNVNELAGFSERIAADLVRNGFAVLVNEGEIDIESFETAEETTPAGKHEFDSILGNTKAEIEVLIKSKNEDGNFVLIDSDLSKMVAEERNGKARKGVIKLIEDEIFERLKNESD